MNVCLLNSPLTSLSPRDWQTSCGDTRETERPAGRFVSSVVGLCGSLFFAEMTDGKGKADSSGAAEMDTHEGAGSHTSIA